MTLIGVFVQAARALPAISDPMPNAPVLPAWAASPLPQTQRCQHLGGQMNGQMDEAMRERRNGRTNNGGVWDKRMYGQQAATDRWFSLLAFGYAALALGH